MHLLDFEKEIFDEVVNNDGLLIMAKGLGLEKILIMLIKLYCEPTNLVLVLNANVKDEEYIMDSLKLDGCDCLPKSINSDISVQERISVYMNGGVIFVTNRILVVDLLVNRIPSHLVTGIIVFRAHKVIESCQESFILRLYREKNKLGFIKAFSDSPTSFTRGYCLLDRTLKSLFLKNLFLWPRFRSAVVACCDKNKIDVIELHIPLSSLMKECQSSLLDLISACIKELKLNSQISNMEEINVESATLNSFDRVLRHHLDPIWHQLSPKVRQIVADLKTMRELLQSLTQHDCFNFNRLVSALRSSEEIFKSNSGWLFTDSAEKLIVFAKRRTENNVNEETGLILDECPKLLVLQEVLQEIRNDLKFSKARNEENLTLKDLEPVESSKTVKAIPRVFIAAHDEQTCDLISKFLCNAPKIQPKKPAQSASKSEIMENLDETKLKRKKTNPRHGSFKAPPNRSTLNKKTSKNDVTIDEFNFSQADLLHSTLINDDDQTLLNKDLVTNDNNIYMDISGNNLDIKCDSDNNSKISRCKQDDILTPDLCKDMTGDSNVHQIMNLGDESSSTTTDVSIHDGRLLTTDKPDGSNDLDPILDLLTIIHPMYDAEDPYKLRRIVDEIMPEFIIFYDANVAFVRQLEVFKASNAGHKLRAYFLIYANSTEEQRYLTTLAKEQSAFEYLIREKATMVIPEEREGRDIIPRDLGKSAAVVGNNDVTRIGGLTGECTRSLVIVDMREFRSELPSLLHRRGIDVQPVTIQVGDYILTPEICVERKSLSDLIGSLHNGRLYTQCMSMCRTYKKAILLIEFDPSKPFLLQDRSTKQGEIASHDIISRLVLLTLHFPRLLLIWSQGPFVTAELFEDIKEKREQPNAEEAMAMTGSDPEANSNSAGQYNPAPYDMLLKLPGITHSNCHLILRKVKNIQELAAMSLEQLRLLLGNELQAQRLYDFMNLNSRSEAYVDAAQAKVDSKRKIPAKNRDKHF